MQLPEEPRGDSGRKVHFEDWCAVLALPLVVTLLNDSWIFSAPSGLDRWIYVGLHLHLPVLLHRFPDAYYTSREPWDFLGWAIHRLLPAEPALYVLHLLVLYLSAFALYAAVRLLFSNRFAALSATALMCVQSTFLIAAGRNYVDGFYVACLTISLAALAAVAVGKRWRTAAVMWGVAATCTVSTYAFWAVLIAVELASFVLINRVEKRRSLLAAGAYFAFSAVAAAVALGLLNVSLGGGFLYFWPQLAALRSVAANNPKWFEPVSVWANHSPYAIASAATWLFSIAVLAWSSLDSTFLAENGNLRRRLQIVCGMNLAALLTFVLFQSFHFALFQFQEYVNALLPFAFLTIGGAIATASAKMSRSSTAVLAFVVYALVLAPWIASAILKVSMSAQLFDGALFSIGWSIVACAVLLLGLFRPREGVILSVGAFTVIGFGAVSNLSDLASMSMPANNTFKQQTLAVFDASTLVGRYDEDGAVRFWFDVRDPFATLQDDVNSTYLAGYTKINERFPDPQTANAEQPIEPGDRIVIMTSTVEDPVSQADRSLASRHITLRQIANQEVRRPGVAFRVVVAEAELDPHFLGQIIPMKAEGERKTLSVNTPPVAWAYATLLQIPRYDPEADYRNSVIRLKVRVTRGRFWIGVLARSGKSFLARRQLGSGSQSQSAVFTGIDLAEAGGVVIQNGPVAEAGRLDVDAAEIVIPKVRVVRTGRRN